MKATLLTSLRVTLTTLSSRRNIQELNAPTDLVAVAKISNDTHELAANNVSANNARSEILLGAVVEFLHITSSAPVQVTLSCTVSNVTTSLVIPVKRHMTITGVFSEVKVKNLGITDPVTIKAIVA